MSTETTTTNTSQVTLVHPDGTIKLMVPTDVPLTELMPDFLDVARQPDRDGWELGPAGSDPYEDEQRTLAELGVREGAVLVLHEPTGIATDVSAHPPPEPETQTETVRKPAPRPPTRPPEAERPLRERTAQTLPAGLSRSARWSVAVRAVTGGREAVERHAAGIPDPATFTRPARVTPLARAREAWTQSDYQ